MPFVKLWDNILDNVKVQRLNATTFKSWVNLLCVTLRYGGAHGELPSWEDMAFGLRESKTNIKSHVDVLVTAGLIDKTASHYSIHDFDKWNESKDKTAAKRQREWRNNRALRNAQRNGVTEPQHNTPEELEGLEVLEEKEEHPPKAPQGGSGSVGDLAPEDNPEIERTANLTAEMAGDISWAMWVRNQARMGWSPTDIQTAVEVCVNKCKWSRELADGVLKRIARERAEKNGKGIH